ncbi:MAG TPA: alcohol dehydrogenase catalytic domain-containing protein [Ktedonobacterales bacterium]|nr:alcohol dehydrogenase catalytic domain-containing protein [Ktedonobacterales bacterium]
MSRIVPAGLLNERGGQVTIEDVIVDAPGPGEVLVRIEATGLCHTDLTARRDALVFPVVLGHEGAGVVEEVGPGVLSPTVGTPVVLAWKTPCGRCPSCRRGRQPWCETPQATAGPRIHRKRDGADTAPFLRVGSFCRYVVVPADAAVPISPALPFSVAALLGCGVATGLGAALFEVHIEPGMDVAIFGLGGVGLNVAQGAAMARAGKIIGIDLLEEKLMLARQFGTTDGVRAGADAVERVRGLTGGRGVDVAFEVVGHPQIMAQGLDVLAPGGTLALVGAPARDAAFSFLPRHNMLSLQQVIRGCVYGACRPALHFPLFAQWALEGTLKLGELITVTISSLNEVNDALLDLQSGQGLRTVLVFQ